MSGNPTDEYRPSDNTGAEIGETVTGPDTAQNDYQSRTGQSEIPVVSDSAKIEDQIDANTADSDEQLARDDNEAIDESNIIDSKTRGAKPSGGYQEPGDEEGLPTDDGTSAVSQ